jgi:ribonuclease P/MRP protein subunit RPP40
MYTGVLYHLLDWISSWLHGRQQRVSIHGKYSGWNNVDSGVPQGSVLGPVLFLIFINDIDDGLLSHILKFADDTKIFNKVQNEDDHQILQADIASLGSWSSKWQMEFNTTKCKVLLVGRTNQKFQYELNRQILESTEQERDLGIVITNDLKSAGNCQAAYNKANRVLGMIKRFITNKTQDIMLPLYKSLVRPLVEYCTPAWSPHYNKDKELLEKIQRRITKMIQGFSNLSYSSRLDKLHLWTLEERRNRADLIELFKMHKGLSCIKIDKLFEPALNSKTRGHSLKLKKHCCHLDLRKYFFSERVVNRWNALSEDAISATTVNSFKDKLQRIREKKISFYTDT